MISCPHKKKNMRPDTPYRLRLLRDPSLTPILALAISACGGGGGKSTRQLAGLGAPSASEALPLGRAKSAGDLSPLLALALAACGGGGGGGISSSSSSSEPNQMPTALAIMSEALELTHPITQQKANLDLLQQNDSGDWVARYDEERQLSATHLATLTLTDDALGDNQLTLSDATYLELRETDDRLVWQLWVKQGARFDYEAAAQHEIALTLNTNAALAQRIVIKIGDRDDPPSAVILSETELTLEEGTQEARKLADISFTDPDTDPKHQDNQVRLSDDRLFELKNNNTELWLKEGAELDFETAQSHSVTLTANPTITQIAKRFVDGTYPDDVTFAATTFTLTVTDVDETPTAMQLSADTAEIEEGTITAKKLADITFTDDALDDNEVTIPNSNIFEIRDKTELWLKAGTLDYETATSHTITLTGTGGHTADFTLGVADVDENLPPALNLLGQQSVREDSRVSAKGRAVFSGGDGSQGIRFFISASNVDTQINSDGTQVEGRYGRLEVNRDGSWAYFLDNGNETVDGLQSGQRLTDSFNVLFRNNANELLISQKLTITILGGTDIYILQEEDGRDLRYGFMAFGERRDIILHNDKDVGPQDGNYFHLDVGHGDDVVHGGPAREWISGEGGNDELYGGGGDDGMRGGDGNDILFGDAGDDDMHGGDGDDELYGGAGDDELSGGIGNDILDGGAHGAEGDEIRLGYSVNSNLSLTLDATDISLWQRGFDGVWSQGTDSGFIYRRFWLDLDNDGEGGEVDTEGQEIRDSDDQYHYFTNIERIVLSAGNGNDVFILDISADEKIFADGFTRRAQIDGEKDKVGIHLPSAEILVIENAEDSLKALKEMLGIDWKQDTGTSRYTYDDSTTIYRTADDTELMELGDFAGTMTFDMFELLPLETELA
jgi:VCBS repeat-containing protein